MEKEGALILQRKPIWHDSSEVFRLRILQKIAAPGRDNSTGAWNWCSRECSRLAVRSAGENSSPVALCFSTFAAQQNTGLVPPTGRRLQFRRWHEIPIRPRFFSQCDCAPNLQWATGIWAFVTALPMLKELS